jgi:mannose-6-phosphate isomerase-like protein (cupin superfamily)
MTSPTRSRTLNLDRRRFAGSITSSGMTDAPAPDGGLVPQPKKLRFLSNTASIHCSQQVAGFGLIEMRAAPGTQTPLHVHRVESEAFFVLAGALRLRIGDRSVHLNEGQSTLAEPGVPHAVVVESGDPARWLVITNGGFDRFVSTVATDEDRSRLADPQALRDIAARFGIDIVHSTPATTTADHVSLPGLQPTESRSFQLPAIGAYFVENQRGGRARKSVTQELGEPTTGGGS